MTNPQDLLTEGRRLLAEGTPRPWRKRVSIYSDGMFDAHWAIETVDKQPAHPWSPRVVAWMTGTLRSDIRLQDIPNAKYCKACDRWHVHWREVGVDVRADPKTEGDAALIAFAVNNLGALLGDREERDRLQEHVTGWQDRAEKAEAQRDDAEKRWCEANADTDKVRQHYVAKLMAAEAERDRLAAEVERLKTETGWLIEWPSTPAPQPRWWHPEHGWTADAARAIRYARKEDAEAAIKRGCFVNGVFASEHQWVTPRVALSDTKGAVHAGA